VARASVIAVDDALIVGLDIIISAAPCGRAISDALHYCDGATVRLAYHSVKSRKLILRCPQCRGRRGHPTESEVATLKQFVKTYGWTQRVIVLGEDGVARVR
jgi:hypothetical protein